MLRLFLRRLAVATTAAAAAAVAALVEIIVVVVVVVALVAALVAAATVGVAVVAVVAAAAAVGSIRIRSVTIIPIAMNLSSQVASHRFLFDAVFNEADSNDDIYRAALRPLLKHVFEGGSATVFAFGQVMIRVDTNPFSFIIKTECKY